MPMTPTTRARLVVAALALGAAAVVVGAVAATHQSPAQPKAQCSSTPKPFLVPGVSSPRTGAVRAALRRPLGSAVRELQPLAHAHPRDPVVQFNYGSVLFCAGYPVEAEQAYRAAKRAGYDTFYEIQADAILHPRYFQQGYPPFQASTRHPDPLLVQGMIAQRDGHQHSAERLYARAARRHPGDDEAQVAAAVARFDEDDLAASFSRLGPLVRRFPSSQSVRFHLGLLLTWTGQGAQAVREFRLARRLGPRTTLGMEAKTFLDGLVSNGTSSRKR
jgi:Tfp pilus assembly protein PilF